MAVQNSMTETTQTVVSFDRIGRTHDVAALTLDVPAGSFLDRADFIAEEVYAYARPMLGSRDVEVEVGLADGGRLDGHGWISCGMRNGGTFTLAQVQP